MTIANEHSLANGSTDSTRRTAVRVALMAILVAIPIVAFPFRADERFAIYADSAEYAANPIRIVSGAGSEIDFFIGRGNFRPIGRMLDYAEHSVAFEVAVSSGASLPFVHGLFRVAAIAILGIAGQLSLVALQRSLDSDRGYTSSVMKTAVILYPLVFGITVIAGGPGSPFTLFPFLYLISTAVPIFACLVVGRMRNLQPGRLGWLSSVGYVLLGAVLASTFDLVYLAVPLLLAYVVIRVALSPHPLLSIPRLRVGKALLFAMAGFSAVFLPTRLLIQQACAGGACYAASDLSFDSSGLSVFMDRLIAGLPFAGWRYVDELLASSDIGWRFFVGNAGASIAALGVLAIGYRVGRSLMAQMSSRMDSDPSAAKKASIRILVVVLWPLSILVSASLLAALSAMMQSDKPAIGFGWRDSGFGAVGWAILLSLILAVVVAAFKRPTRRLAAIWILVMALAVGVGRTYLTNANLAEAAGGDAESIVNNRIAAEVIDFDRSDLGNERRCRLLAEFSDVFHDKQYERDVQLTGVVNWVTEKRYHVPFCDEMR